MKKFIYKGCILLFIFMIMLVQFDMTQVKAAEATKEVTSYYQAIVLNDLNGKYSGFTAVSQYYYKTPNFADPYVGKRNDVATDNAKYKNEAAKFYYDFKGVPSSGGEFNCNVVFGTSGEPLHPNKALCNKTELNGDLFTLAITNYGNVKIHVQNGVNIANIRFYYIIAGYLNDAQLFGSNTSSTVAQNAKKILADNSNWKSKSKTGGSLVFTSSNMAGFTEKSLEGGGKIYKGFNIIDNMDSNYADLAKEYGAYIITAASISYKDKLYTLNNTNSTFDIVGNIISEYGYERTGGSYTYCENVAGEGCTTNLTIVSKAAVLVYPGDKEKESVGYTKMEKYLDSVIIPALQVILIILFMVVGTTTVVTIVKASDEPEVRHSNIKKLIAMFVGTVVVFFLLMFYKEIIEIVRGWFD